MGVLPYGWAFYIVYFIILSSKDALQWTWNFHTTQVDVEGILAQYNEHFFSSYFLHKCVEANSLMNIREEKYLHFNKTWEHPTITKLEYPNLGYAKAIENFFFSLNFGWYDKWRLAIYKSKKCLIGFRIRTRTNIFQFEVQMPSKDHYPKSVFHVKLDRSM
jgi:hypothetical protein